jgi:hypothetical protein
MSSRSEAPRKAGTKMKSNPTPQEIVENLREENKISNEDAHRFLSNQIYFEEKRKHIEQEYASQWVAALSKCLYHQRSYRELELELKDKPDFQFAYIEEVISKK